MAAVLQTSSRPTSALRRRHTQQGPSRAIGGGGGRESIIAGPRPYHNLIPYAPRSRRPSASRGRKLGGVPSHSTRSMGSVISSPSGVRGSRKWILCIFQVRKKPSGTPFSVCLSDGGPPNIAGPGKTFPLSPVLTGLHATDRHVALQLLLLPSLIITANGRTTGSQWAPSKAACLLHPVQFHRDKVGLPVQQALEYIRPV